MASKPEGSISIGRALLLVLIGVVGAAIAFAVAMGIEVGRGASFAIALDHVRGDVVSLALVQLVGLALATGAGVIITFGSDAQFRDALELRPVPAAISVLALTAGLALAFPLRELANMLAQLHPLFAVDRAPRIDDLKDAVTIPLALVAIPAISEELFFRGLLLPGLTQRYGARVALALSSILSGVVHGLPGAIVCAAIAGFILGDLRRRTGSVLPCIALHGALNAVPLLLPADLVPIPGLNIAEGHVPLALTVGGALVALASLFVIGRLIGDPDEG